MLLIRSLASLSLTAGLLALFCIGVLAAHFGGFSFSPVVAASFGALGINLLAMMLTNPRFRQQRPLFVFHLALLAIIFLIAFGRMIYLKGQAELVEGLAFDGQLVSVDAGPWHPWRLDQASFVNRGFSIAYAPGLKRLETRNQVSWVDADGQNREAVIGDDKPLVLQGYRFYTTWNKGFSLLFEWVPERGEAGIGTVNLPSYPANALKQAQQWALPGLQEPLWSMLQFEGELIPADQDGHFRLPDDYRVVVRYADQRWELVPGANQKIALPGGTLRFIELRSWMGYMLTWDATIPWLLGASTIAVLALAWHFWAQFSRRPWDQD
ncbi:MAG: cytochrome c biosis protein ResB [Proteobacteria bacterium]|nr:cytochrome c biosis protein ResB [Pseudomonadota bacterium]